METRDLLDLIERGGETRDVEMKESLDFSETRIKAKIAKSAMGMANTRDGGLIVLGMRELSGGRFEPQGMDPDHLRSIDQDRVSSSVMEYAAPYVELTVTPLPGDERPALKGKTFVVISVLEFSEVPVICKRQYQNEGLREGAIFVRSFERRETREVQTEAEMRELVDLSTEKRLRRLLQITERAGGAVVPAAYPERADEERFQAQREGL
jgi:predicted HTH transcriptional regulator